MPDPREVEYDLDGGWLHAAQFVGGAPVAVTFAFRLVAGDQFAASTPPVRGSDDEVGRAYRVPGPMPIPLPLPEVLARLDGLVLESSVIAEPGDVAEPTATLVLLQERGEGLEELGAARVAFEPTVGGAVKALPRIRLVGRRGGP
jgi:hypothetical protein